MTQGQLTNPEQTKKFVLAGNATITLKSLRTGKRLTFRVREKKKQPNPSLQSIFSGPSNLSGPWFVSVLTGPDNQSDYKYVGLIPAEEPNRFRLTAKSGYGEDSDPVKAWRWLWDSLPLSMPHGIEVWHEGKCGRCGRKLTVPESIEMGIGPECQNKL